MKELGARAIHNRLHKYAEEHYQMQKLESDPIESEMTIKLTFKTITITLLSDRYGHITPKMRARRGYKGADKSPYLIKQKKVAKSSSRSQITADSKSKSRLPTSSAKSAEPIPASKPRRQAKSKYKHLFKEGQKVHTIYSSDEFVITGEADTVVYTVNPQTYQTHVLAKSDIIKK